MEQWNEPFRSDAGNQVSSFGESLDLLSQYRELLEYIIEETLSRKGESNMAYYLMDDGWKRYLDDIPGRGGLLDYNHYFWVFLDKSERARPEYDAKITGQVQMNRELADTLDALGKPGDIMEIDFLESCVRIRLTKPLFSKGIPAELYYLYKGHGENYDETKEKAYVA